MEEFLAERPKYKKRDYCPRALTQEITKEIDKWLDMICDQINSEVGSNATVDKLCEYGEELAALQPYPGEVGCFELAECKVDKQSAICIKHNHYSVPDHLVICDEMGYVSCDKEGAELLFSHLSLRSGSKATIITTNLPFTR